MIISLPQAQHRGIPPDQGGGATRPAGPGQRAESSSNATCRSWHPRVRPGQLEVEYPGHLSGALVHERVRGAQVAVHDLDWQVRRWSLGA